MTIRGLLAAIVRLVGLGLLLVALQTTGQAIFLAQISRDKVSCTIYVAALWLIAAGLVLFANRCAGLLALGIAEAKTPWALHPDITIDDLSRLAFRVIGTLLVIWAVTEFVTAVLWSAAHTASDQSASRLSLPALALPPLPKLVVGAAAFWLGRTKDQRR